MKWLTVLLLSTTLVLAQPTLNFEDRVSMQIGQCLLSAMKLASEVDTLRQQNEMMKAELEKLKPKEKKDAK